jgi:hypothetical protein
MKKKIVSSKYFYKKKRGFMKEMLKTHGFMANYFMEHSKFHTSWPKKNDLNIQPHIPNIPNCPFRDPRHLTLEIVNECNLNLPKTVPLHIYTQN